MVELKSIPVFLAGMSTGWVLCRLFQARLLSSVITVAGNDGAAILPLSSVAGATSPVASAGPSAPSILSNFNTATDAKVLLLLLCCPESNFGFLLIACNCRPNQRP